MADTATTITLKFLDWQELYNTEKPFQIFINIPEDAEDKRNSNLVFEDIDLPIQDIRTSKNKFSLDDNGFQFIKHSSSLTNFQSRESVEKIYLPEVEALLRKEVQGVDKVFFFDWRVGYNTVTQRVLKG